MTEADRRHIQWWLRFKPDTADDFVRKADAFDELVPLLIEEIRDLRHERACWRTQGGDYVKNEEVEDV